MFLDHALNTLPEAARKRLEELMTTSTYEYKSDFARGYKAEGIAESVLGLLERRRVEVPDEKREKILGCTDPEQLEEWFDRAFSAKSVDELFR